MLDRIAAFLAAGDPPHWQVGAVVLAILVIDWWLPRVKNPEARSLLEAIANLLRNLPIVGRIFGALATPYSPQAAAARTLAALRQLDAQAILAGLLALSPEDRARVVQLGRVIGEAIVEPTPPPDPSGGASRPPPTPMPGIGRLQ